MKFLFSKFILFTFISFTIILFSNIQFFNVCIFSQEVDKKGFGVQERERARIHADNDSKVDDKKGFGVQERERARIHPENDSQIFNNDFASLIILATIIVIVAVSSYALYKILIIRRKSNQFKPKK